MKKIMLIDLAVFSILAVFTEVAGTVLLKDMVPLFYCTLSMAVAQIAMLRWGAAGIAVQAAAGTAALLLGDMKLLDGLIFCVAANLCLGIPMALYGERDRDVIVENPLYFLLYLILSHLCLCAGKGIAILAVTGERSGFVDFFGASLLVFIINTIALLVLRSVKNLMIDMRTYYGEG